MNDDLKFGSILKCGLYFILLCFFIPIYSCKQIQSAESNIADEDSCDHPDADINCLFINIPDQLTSDMFIPHDQQSTNKLHINGIIYKSDGVTPASGVIMYAYHTDETGHYAKSGKEIGVQKWHGKHHGWCKIDEHGKYSITSIRPAPYPDATIPAHIHAALKIPSGNLAFYINDFVFEDDPLINQTYVKSLQFTGGNGIVHLKRDDKNTWIGERNIILK